MCSHGISHTKVVTYLCHPHLFMLFSIIPRMWKSLESWLFPNVLFYFQRLCHVYILITSFYGFGMPGYAALFWWGEDVIIPVGTRTWSNISLWQSPFLTQAGSVDADSNLSFGKHRHISSPRHLLSNCDPPPYENWIVWMSISNWLQWQLYASRCMAHYSSLKTSHSQPLPHKASNTCHPIFSQKNWIFKMSIR